MLHVFGNTNIHVVAESLSEAIEIANDYYADGEDYADDMAQCDDDDIVRIWIESPEDRPKPVEAIEMEAYPGVWSATCRQWAAASGKGLLCSEDY